MLRHSGPVSHEEGVTFPRGCCCSVTKLCLTLRPHGLGNARLPCPSSSPRVCSDSCPLSWYCHPTISSSATCFSFRLQSFPASGSFWGQGGGQSIILLPPPQSCARHPALLQSERPTRSADSRRRGLRPGGEVWWGGTRPPPWGPEETVSPPLLSLISQCVQHVPSEDSYLGMH